MCVTEEIAVQLGFDTTEVSTQIVTLADGKQRKVPKIAPIEIAFENRTYVTEAVVLGDEPLLGLIPMEAMPDLGFVGGVGGNPAVKIKDEGYMYV